MAYHRDSQQQQGILQIGGIHLQQLAGRLHHQQVDIAHQGMLAGHREHMQGHLSRKQIMSVLQ